MANDDFTTAVRTYESPDKYLYCRDAYSYFIIDSEQKYLKIGVPRDPESRLEQLRIACPLELTLLVCIKGGRQTERYLKSALAKFIIRGEWYVFNDEVQEVITRTLENNFKTIPDEFLL
jgi:hypothetical protein